MHCLVVSAKVADFCRRLCGLVLLLVVAGPLPGAFAAAGEGGLLAGDCIKCHWLQEQRLAENGGAHAAEVGCLDCHPGHPPRSTDTVADCGACHVDQPHFQAGNCQQCHADPHQPLTSLRDPLKPARTECLSCHAAVGAQMAAAPSRHAGLFCNRCHARHKEIPGCLECHAAHHPQQVGVDCLKCHPAHQPTLIAPKGYVPAKFCQPCHASQTKALAETNTSHGGINCVFCHKGLHPSVPKCQDCHGLPHSQAVHSQFRQCLKCHGDAHRLISRNDSPVVQGSSSPSGFVGNPAF